MRRTHSCVIRVFFIVLPAVLHRLRLLMRIWRAACHLVCFIMIFICYRNILLPRPNILPLVNWHISALVHNVNSLLLQRRKTKDMP